MILQQMATALRQRDWFTVVIELLIVVLGVFLGLQAQQWSSERAEARQHARYFERLQTDFAAIDARIDGHLSVFKLSIDSLEHVLDLVRLPDEAFEAAEIDEPRLKLALANLGTTRIPPGRSATYAEMLALGQLSSIRNDAMRDTLAEYDRLSAIHLEVFRSASDLMNSQIPITHRHITFDTVPDEGEVSGIRKVVLGYDLQGMRSDPEFEAALEILEFSTRNNQGVRKVEKKLTEEILALLTAEVRK